jgi:hypothetical protein
LESRLIPSSTTLQFSVGSETVNETAGTFSIPVTLTGALPPPTTTTFATFTSSIFQLAFDPAGNLFVASISAVKEVTPAGVVSTLASGFTGAQGLAFHAGNVYITDGNNVDMVTPAGAVSTFASGFNGPPQYVAFDPAGNLYVSSEATTAGISTVSKVVSTVTVPYTLGGTAAGGTDYSGVTAGTLTFGISQTTENITGTLIDDGSPDASKTITFTLGTPSSNAGLGSLTANILTIGEPVNNPAPTLTSISPNSITAGSPDTTIALTGSSFVNGSTADFNGTAITTTFVSATQLTAVIPASDLATGGTDMITVVTAGPGGGASAAQTFTVSAASTTTVAANASAAFNSSVQTVPLSATVTSAADTVNEGTETFTILNGATVIGTAVTVNVVSGAASANYALPAGTAAGSYTIQAVYNGDANFLAFTDNTHHLTVNAVTTTGVLSSASPSAFGNPVTLTATVTDASGAASPTGTVEFFNGNVDLGPGTALSGAGFSAASTISSTLPFGSDTIKAVYTPSGAFASSSGTVKQVVTAVAATAVLNSDGSLWQYTAAGGMQLLTPFGTIRAISTVLDVHGQTDIFAITTGLAGAQYNNTLWEYASGGWSQQSSGAFSRISAATDSAGQSIVFGLLTNGSLWEQSHSLGVDSGWTELSGNGTIKYISAVTDALGNDNVYAIVTAQVDSQYANTLWEHVPTGWRQD